MQFKNDHQITFKEQLIKEVDKTLKRPLMNCLPLPSGYQLEVQASRDGADVRVRLSVQVLRRGRVRRRKSVGHLRSQGRRGLVRHGQRPDLQWGELVP